MKLLLSFISILLLSSSTQLNLPKQVELIYDKKHRIVQYAHIDEYTIVVYRGPEVCTSCSIKEIIPLEGLFNLVRRYSNIKFLVLFSPLPESYMELRSTLLLADLRFPVYIDFLWNKYVSFIEKNGVIE